jgi:hypothetical protein
MTTNKLQKQIAAIESSIESGAVKVNYKRPYAIRDDLLVYKGKKDITQTELAKRVGVNPTSFGHFLHFQYKNQMNAKQNSAYWAAAEFLAMEKAKEKRAALQAQLPHDKQGVGNARNGNEDEGEHEQLGAPAKRAKAGESAVESHSAIAPA